MSAYEAIKNTSCLHAATPSCPAITTLPQHPLPDLPHPTYLPVSHFSNSPSRVYYYIMVRVY